MIKLIRKGLTLSMSGLPLPLQGSCDVPFTLISDDDEYKDYATTVHIGWKDSRDYKAQVAKEKDNVFLIPTAAFKQAGLICFSVGLIHPIDGHVEKTMTTLAEVVSAPVGEIVIKDDLESTEIAAQIIEQIFNASYKKQFNELVEGISETYTTKKEFNEAVENISETYTTKKEFNETVDSVIDEKLKKQYDDISERGLILKDKVTGKPHLVFIVDGNVFIEEVV